MVQIDGCQLFKLFRVCSADLVDYKLQELLDQVQVVDEDLQEILYSYFLVRFHGKFVFVYFKLLAMLLIVNHG